LYTLFLLYIVAVAAAVYFVLWDEIEKIRELVPEDNREGKDNCYDNPLLNIQIWTREGHFYPFYKMQDVVAYFDCLETEDALDEVRFFYITYNVGSIAAVMGFVAFLLVIVGYPVKYALELVCFPLLVESGEGVFIYYLAGKFQEDGIGGLTEVYCQLCSSIGLIFWVFLAFIMLLFTYSLFKECCRCSKDRQQGKNIGTIRDEMAIDRSFSEAEMQPGRVNSSIF